MDDRSGRPTTVSTPKNKERIEAAILENRRVTVSELEHGLGLSDGTIASIIQEFGFHKVCVSWILQPLSEDHKTHE
jgi:hypothetical protein